MSDAVNKSLDDVIKERKKTEGKGTKKGGKKPGAKQVSKRAPGKPRQGRTQKDQNKPKKVQRKAISKKPTLARMAIRRTRAGGAAAAQLQKPEKKIEPVGKRRLRVSNLDFNITHKDLMDLFSKFGGLTKNRIDYDDLGRSKGSAIIEYEKEESATKAIEEYDGATLDGKTLSVTVDTPAKNKVPLAKKAISKRDVRTNTRTSGREPPNENRRNRREGLREGGRREGGRREGGRREGGRREDRRDDRAGGRNRGGRKGGNQQKGGNRRDNNRNRNNRPQNKKNLGAKKSE